MTPRPLYWSIRRELWENRSVYMAPLIAAGVVLFGFTLSAIHLSQNRRRVLELDPARRLAEVSMPYHLAAAAVVITGLVVAIFYCLDALYSERRDRGILFWKSLPLSDVTTVISKAAIPMAVMPAVVFVVVVAVQAIMVILSSAILAASGIDVGAEGTRIPLVTRSITLLYDIVALTLWYAPVWGWLLLVSAWAKRAPFLWATLPLLTVCLVEGLAFQSSHFAHLLGYRLGGGISGAFTVGAGGRHGTPSGGDLADLDPVRFLSNPDLWSGLAFAAAFLAAAVWLRRRREPI